MTRSIVLTSKEQAVIDEILAGSFETANIKNVLAITGYDIQTRLESIYEKYQVRNKAGLILALIDQINDRVTDSTPSDFILALPSDTRIEDFETLKLTLNARFRRSIRRLI